MKEKIINLCLLLLIVICFGLVLCSCHTMTKSQTTSKVDSANVKKSDSAVKTTVDSSTFKHSTTENENRIEIEFDSAGGVIAYPTGAVGAEDYFTPQNSGAKLTGHIKKIILTGKQSTDILEGGSLIKSQDFTVQKVDSGSKKLTTVVKTKTVKGSWFMSLWWLWLLIIVVVVYVLRTRLKEFAGIFSAVIQ